MYASALCIIHAQRAIHSIMWLFIYKKYHNSRQATLLSVAGLILRFAGLIFACRLDIKAILFFGAGVLFHYTAEHIHFTKWVQVIRAEGYEKKLAEGSIAVAGELYKIYPSKRTVRYISSINAEVGKKLQEIIAQVKAEEKK